MKQLHKIQRDILYKLLFSSGLRYSEVKPSKRIENNQFDFHLDQLIKLGYIEHKEALYHLTNSGKDFTNRIDRNEIFLFFCGVENPTGNLKPNKEGTFTWIDTKDFKKFVTNHFESYDVFLQDVKLVTNFSGEVKLVERDQFTDKY